MHLPFDNGRNTAEMMLASSNVSYFSFFFVADVKFGLCEINKNTDRVWSKKCSETEPK